MRNGSQNTGKRVALAELGNFKSVMGQSPWRKKAKQVFFPIHDVQQVFGAIESNSPLVSSTLEMLRKFHNRASPRKPTESSDVREMCAFLESKRAETF